MSDTATDRFALPLMQVAQAQKEVTHNEALTMLDMLVHAAALAEAAEPPAGAAAGQCWIVAAGGQGAWAGQDGRLACLTAGGWRFVPPRAGLRVYVADSGTAFFHDGSGWRRESLRVDGVYIDDQKIVGARRAAIDDPVGGSIVDGEARAAVASILAALRGHGLIAAS